MADQPTNPTNPTNPPTPPTPPTSPLIGREPRFAGKTGVCQYCGKPANHDTGSTCLAHLGKVGKYYQLASANPADDPKYMPLTKLCDLAQELGKSRGFAVALCGGDAGTKQPAKGFEVVVWGKRKYVAATAAKALRALVKATAAK